GGGARGEENSPPSSTKASSPSAGLKKGISRRSGPTHRRRRADGTPRDTAHCSASSGTTNPDETAEAVGTLRDVNQHRREYRDHPAGIGLFGEVARLRPTSFGEADG